MGQVFKPKNIFGLSFDRVFKTKNILGLNIQASEIFWGRDKVPEKYFSKCVFKPKIFWGRALKPKIYF